MGGLQQVLSIGELHPECRASAWKNAICEKYYISDFEFPATNFAFGQLAIEDVSNIRVGRVQADPYVVRRRRNHLGSHADDYYLVLIPCEQPLRMRQQGREAVVAAGDLVVVGSGDAYDYEQRNRNDILTMRVPGRVLRDRIRDIDDWTANRFQVSQSSVSLFVDFAKSFILHGRGLSAVDAASSARVLLDLMAIAIGTAGRYGISDETSVRVAHRQRALRLIDAHLSDSALRPSFVAAKLGLSDRYLQQIFAHHDENLSAVIRTRRIEEAKRMLCDHSFSTRSISSIAYAVGFSDPAHFSRTFLAETSASPRDYRSAHSGKCNS